MKDSIDYEKIACAIAHYNRIGYERVDVPWLVSPECCDATRPKEARPFSTFAGNLVASGEQSFISIMKDLCPRQKYMCVTPCFRDEKYDELHLMQFIKVELIQVLWQDDDPNKFIKTITSDALSFFRPYASNHPKVEETDLGIDIKINDIEVGSYGLRQFNGYRWIYGTGCAEPRLSMALKSR